MGVVTHLTMSLLVSQFPQSRRLIARPFVTLEPAFKNSRIRRLELSLVGFNAAEFGTWVAILVFAYRVSGVGASGLVGFTLLTSAALLAPFAPALAERYFKGRALMATYLSQVTLNAATGATMLLGVPLPIVVALAAAACICLTASRPLVAGILPVVAETPHELTGASVAAGWIESFGFVVGPAMAGLILLFTGPGIVYLVMAAGLVGSALLVSGIEAIRSGQSDSVLSIVSNLTAGLRALTADRAVRAVASFMGAHYLILGAVDVLMITLAFQLLHLGQSGMGLLTTVFGLGCVVGASASLLLASGRRLAGGLVAGAMAWGISLTLVSLIPGRVVVALLIALAGVGRPLIIVSGRLLLQRVASETAIIPLFAVLEGLSMAAIGLGLAAMPAVIGGLGDRASFVAAGLVLPILVLVLFQQLSALENEGILPEERLRLLRSVPMFAPLSLIAVDRLARNMIPVEALPGEAIVRQGAPGHDFYMVASGCVTVDVDGRTVRALGQGDFFGEIALLHEGVRTATVTADGSVRLYALGRNDFLTAVTGHPESTTRAAGVADSRLGDAAPRKLASHRTRDQ